MNFQTLSKPSNRSTIALIVTTTAFMGMTVFYGLSQLRQRYKASEPVVAAPIIRQVTALGRLEPATKVINVSVPASLNNDRVAKLLVQWGDRLEAGQVIAVMDSRDRLQNDLLEAQAQVKVSQVELAKVKAGAKSGEISAQKAEIARLRQQLKGEIATQQATIARWQAEVTAANANYSRYLPLYKEGAISTSELDDKQLALKTARAQLNEARAKQNQSVNTLQEQIRQASATLDKIAEVRPVDLQAARAEVDKSIVAVKKANTDLDKAYIRAPVAGRILEIYAKPGEVVDENGIAELGQTSQMQVVAEVYQTDVSKIRQGQQATITSESFPGQLHGIVRLVGLQVTKQEVTSGEPGENLDRRVVDVQIHLNPEDSQRVANLTNLQVQAAIKL